MKYSAAKQERVIRSQFPSVIHRLQSVLNANDKEILTMAISRGIGLGINEYGDESFHKTKPLLKLETLEELADAVFYQSIYQAKVRGTIK